MSSFPPNSPYGLPTTPRATKQMLSPINTSLPLDRSATPSPSSTLNEKDSTQTFVDTRLRNRDSMIFVNATIPLSPVSSLSHEPANESPLNGLAPRKRNGLARLFCCFGREERARRRAMWAMEYEKVGEQGHWSEY